MKKNTIGSICAVGVMLILLTLLMLLIVKTSSTIKSSPNRVDITFNEYVVTDLGQCTKNTCSFTAKGETGDVWYGTSRYKPLSIGQKVERECWTDTSDNKRWCYNSIKY